MDGGTWIRRKGSGCVGEKVATSEWAQGLLMGLYKCEDSLQGVLWWGMLLAVDTLLKDSCRSEHPACFARDSLQHGSGEQIIGPF